MDMDIERQGRPKNDGTGSEKKTTTKMASKHVNHPLMMKIISTTLWLFKYFHWDVAFLEVCVVAVAVDPLFFYLPVVNDATKCITIDKTLKIIAICVRSFLDLIALGDLVARKINKNRHMKSSDYVINILSILPVHQVLMPIIFSEMSRSNIGIFLNTVVLSQYVPRILRIYRVWRIVNDTIVLPKNSATVEVINRSYKKVIPPKGLIIVMKAGLNLFLYLIASHALGAFWYFFSIRRETTCWQLAACEHDIGICSTSTSFKCGDGFGNYTFLNNYCPLEISNSTTFFDFGIFQEARQSGILASMDIPRKTLFCFWWGLRSLSSFGQNLETSPYFWENCFTVLISIFGLLLFLYFIGNLQVYMQWEVNDGLQKISKRLEEEDKAKVMSAKMGSIKGWISTIGLNDHELKDIIMGYVTPILLDREDQDNDIDTENPFPHLPKPIRRWIMSHLCLRLLRKIPMFKNEKEKLLSKITCKFLKQVQYNQNSYIVREGEPLDAIIFMVNGIVWTYTSNHGDKTDCLGKDGIFGSDQLVEWALESLKSSGLSNIPLSRRTLKCHTKVEAFCLMASDLKDMMSQYWWRFSIENIIKSDSEQLKHFAASSIKEAWRRHAINSSKIRPNQDAKPTHASSSCFEIFGLSTASMNRTK
ncbi:hypothetical protein I3842_06G008700 [Carya illinoinensis]|uniref:Cyclic nucleotide-binding domain-containing protein n=1 Tax=Carya illinoinensis TaxID=32201 RepID=A0A922JJU4_CARIL|nr:hypothetical protein I3842_06G008700 [Carya illinoinensis]KAG6706956.1 hypothetical protein I3842_06G008700 [Carya illinoinensis]KAG6706958.1 hypothetical protein I3842_06G008700 [Carya illinoinensis]KAG6706959.1 hypothetical protein I3842_06G008700 [Carya illinoinensis]KAG6706960.1 hypothetical protein I3842_06G008700 [Carya illinoinensis]